jgi:transposase
MAVLSCHASMIPPPIIRDGQETAMRPYSIDLRQRVAATGDHGEGTLREIARRLRVSLSFIVHRLQHRRDAGTLASQPHGGGPPSALGPDERQRRAGLIHEQPDATWEQLKQQGGFDCSGKTLGSTWRRLNLTRKKKTLHVSERDRPEVQKERRWFRSAVRHIESKRLVFLDETGITTTMTPTDAWTPRGERARGSVPTS